MSRTAAALLVMFFALPATPSEVVAQAIASTGVIGSAGIIDTAGESDSAGTILSVTTDPPGARVYRDSVLLGATPLETFLPSESPDGGEVIRLRIVGGEPGRWFAPVVLDSFPLPAGGPAGVTALARHYDLPLAARIASDPQGAEVLLGDSLLGSTPLFVLLQRSVPSLTLRMEGYRPETVLLLPGTPDYTARLTPSDPSGGPLPRALAVDAGKNTATLFAATGSAVAAGAVAAWMKNRADGAYAEYRSTGDRGLLDRVRRYDLYSGIALAAAEISLGYLVIQLLSR